MMSIVCCIYCGGVSYHVKSLFVYLAHVNNCTVVLMLKGGGDRGRGGGGRKVEKNIFNSTETLNKAVKIHE